MMYICSQCGNQIPDDAEFCYYCGCLKSKALKMDDSGHIETGVCHVCGEPVKGGESFCTKCGAALVLERPMVPVKMDGRRIAALILATIPAFFNIFGLGHLVMKQWSRGFMFLAMTAVMCILCPFWVPSPSFFVMILRVGLFMYSVFDAMRYIYSPEVK